MSQGAWHEVVRTSPLLAGLEVHVQEEILGHAVSRTLPRGHVLFRQGEPATALYVVVSGRLKLVQEDASGHQVVVRFVGPPHVVAAVAVTPGHRYPVTAVALEKVAVALWPAETLRELCRRYPALSLNAMQEVAAHMEDMQRRFLELASERVEQRLARCFVRLSGQVGRPTSEGILLDVPISRQDLAAMTGTTLYTVSRILSHWESEGLVRTARQKLTILNLQAFTALLEELPEGG